MEMGEAGLGNKQLLWIDLFIEVAVEGKAAVKLKVNEKDTQHYIFCSSE